MTEFHKTSDFFTAFRRTYGFPYFYREQPLYWFREVGKWGVGIGYITAVLALTVIIAFLGTRGYSRWRITLQMIISLGIGFSIILCVSGVFWQGCDYQMNENGDLLKYKVHIGLYQANISMARMPPSSSEYSEYHNVKIGWKEVHQAEEEYNEALTRGWPVGILRLARYVSSDMEGMQYMRSFRWSGYAASILLWTAFSTWLLSNALIGANVSYAAAFLLLTGGLQLLACVVYSVQAPDEFYIPMDDGKGTKLRLRYDWMFWLTLFMGIFVVLISAIILVLDYLRPADMNKFFGTTSEIHSPYDDELAQNQNKDIKGMIRSLSQKRSRHDVKKHMQNNLDVERTRKTPFNIYGQNGMENPAYAKSMSSIHEGDEHTKGIAQVQVPEIQVEMVDLPCETEDKAFNNAEQPYTESNHNVDTHIDSEPECEKHLENEFVIDSPTEAEGGVRPRSSSSVMSSTIGDSQLLTDEDN